MLQHSRLKLYKKFFTIRFTLYISQRVISHKYFIEVDIDGKSVKSYDYFLKISDNEEPTFSVASINNIAQGTDTGESYATVAWIVPTATDNFGNTPTVTVTPTNYVPPMQLNIGTYTVMYTATDAASNTATLSFTITITG